MGNSNNKNSWTPIHTPGKKFHNWTVVRHAGMHTTPCGKRRSKYLVRCVCGVQKVTLGSTLKKSISCGCIGRPSGRRHVEIGEKFGRWTVKGGPYNMRDSSGRLRVYYHFECECGTVRWKIGNDVWRGRSNSCGCLQKELATEQLKKLRETNWFKRGYKSSISKISNEPLDEPLDNEESSISKRIIGRDLLAELASTVRGVG